MAIEPGSEIKIKEDAKNDHTIRVPEAIGKVVDAYAKQKDITSSEAASRLISTAWGRLGALKAYAAKQPKRAPKPKKEKKAKAPKKARAPKVPKAKKTKKSAEPKVDTAAAA